jgi:hypothetical protein
LETQLPKLCTTCGLPNGAELLPYLTLLNILSTRLQAAPTATTRSRALCAHSSPNPQLVGGDRLDSFGRITKRNR